MTDSQGDPVTSQVGPHSEIPMSNSQRLLVLAQLGVQRDRVSHQGNIIGIDFTSSSEGSTSGIIVLVRSSDNRVYVVRNVRIRILAQRGGNEVVDFFSLGL